MTDFPGRRSGTKRQNYPKITRRFETSYSFTLVSFSDSSAGVRFRFSDGCRIFTGHGKTK